LLLLLLLRLTRLLSKLLLLLLLGRDELLLGCLRRKRGLKTITVEPIHRLGPGGEVLEPSWLLLTSQSYEMMVTSLLSGPELGQQETGQHHMLKHHDGCS